MFIKHDEVSGGGSSTPTVVIDADNSTIVTLAGGATFTGTAVDITDKVAAQLQIFTDEDSATEGVQVQTSVDGVNWDHYHGYFHVGGAQKHYDFALPGSWYRVVYENGSTAQTVFRLQTKLLSVATQSHAHPIDFDLNLDHPAVIVRSVITGETSAGGGGLVNVKVNPSGALTVDAEVTQATHDDLNANANIQVGNVDVSSTNPVPTDSVGNSIIVEVTPVISATAYTEGDAFGGSQTITTPVRVNGGTAVLQNIAVSSKKKLKSQFDFLFFRNAPTATNNAIFAPTDAQVLDDFIGSTTIFAGEYVAFSVNSVGTKDNIGIVFDADSGDDDIFCVMVIRNAHTYAVGDVVVKYGFLQD